MSVEDTVDGGRGAHRGRNGAMLRRLPERLDVAQFVRAHESMSGVAAYDDFFRIATECSGGGDVAWSIAGLVDAEGACWLTLEVEAALKMACQRCLTDVQVDVRSRSRFRLVFAGEQWGDEDLEDDSFEALEIDGPLDLKALVEDEVLLALPSVALHERCDMPGAQENADDLKAVRPSPFAVLGKLKRA
jgi:uncharacterized protein